MVGGRGCRGIAERRGVGEEKQGRGRRGGEFRVRIRDYYALYSVQIMDIIALVGTYLHEARRLKTKSLSSPVRRSGDGGSFSSKLWSLRVNGGAMGNIELGKDNPATVVWGG